MAYIPKKDAIICLKNTKFLKRQVYFQKNSKGKSLHRFVESVSSDWESVLTDFNSFPRFKQFVFLDRNLFPRFQHPTIGGNELQSEITECLNRGNEYLSVGTKTIPWEQFAQFDITIYLWLFWKSPFPSGPTNKKYSMNDIVRDWINWLIDCLDRVLRRVGNISDM